MKRETKAPTLDATPSPDLENRRFVGRRLARSRRALGLTQSELAQSIGASLQTVKSYEAGRRLPSGEFSLGLARTGINLTWLLENQGSMLLAGDHRDAQIDLIGSALGQHEHMQRTAIRSHTVDKRLKAAFFAVDDAARRCGFELPSLLRSAVVLAVLKGMAIDGVEPIIELLQAQAILDGQKKKRISKRSTRAGESDGGDALLSPLVRPRIEPELLTTAKAAIRLRERGVKMNKDRYARLAKEFPDGVPETELSRLVLLFDVGSHEPSGKIALLKRRKS